MKHTAEKYYFPLIAILIKLIVLSPNESKSMKDCLVRVIELLLTPYVPMRHDQ